MFSLCVCCILVPLITYDPKVKGIKLSLNAGIRSICLSLPVLVCKFVQVNKVRIRINFIALHIGGPKEYNSGGFWLEVHKEVQIIKSLCIYVKIKQILHTF